MTRRPGEPLARNARTLVVEASSRVRALSVDEVEALLDSPDHLVVDIRDPRELARGGILPGWVAATQPAPEGGQLWHDRQPRPVTWLGRNSASDAGRDRLWSWAATSTGLGG